MEKCKFLIKEILDSLKTLVIIVGIFTVLILIIINQPKDFMLVSQALLTPTIAFAVALISYGQYKLNQRKLIHDLFDRRIVVFDIITRYVGNIVASGNVEQGKDIEFCRDTRNVFFLFGKEIEDYVYEIYRKSCELRSLNKTLEGLVSEEERRKNIAASGEIFEWFKDQLGSIRVKFDGYLALKV